MKNDRSKYIYESYPGSLRSPRHRFARLVGFIPSVTMDNQMKRAAVGQTVRSPVAPEATTGSIVAAMNPPEDGGQTIGNVDLTISKAHYSPIAWSGEEELSLASGIGRRAIQTQQVAQSLRKLCNEIEADIAGLYKYGSRAIIPNDTSFFKTDLADAAYARKILVDNGAPISELKMVISTSAAVGLRKQATILTPMAEAQNMLTQGVLINAAGFQIRESGQIVTATAGTASSATVNASAYAVGDTVLTLATAGTGYISAGDIITIASDPNYYVVLSGDTNVTDGGTITLAAPGLRKAITASASPAITVLATGDRSMAFARSAIVLGTRLPALPAEGDKAIDRTTITDPATGLSFEVACYPGYRMVRYEVGIAWGVAAVKPEHIAILAG